MKNKSIMILIVFEVICAGVFGWSIGQLTAKPGTEIRYIYDTPGATAFYV